MSATFASSTPEYLILLSHQSYPSMSGTSASQLPPHLKYLSLLAASAPDFTLASTPLSLWSQLLQRLTYLSISFYLTIPGTSASQVPQHLILPRHFKYRCISFFLSITGTSVSPSSLLNVLQHLSLLHHCMHHNISVS